MAVRPAKTQISLGFRSVWASAQSDQSLRCLHEETKMAARLIYVWHYVSVVQLNGCLNRWYFITILWVKDIRTCMIPKVTHTAGSKRTLSYINGMVPFEIKYHLRSILWKITHCAEQHKCWLFNSNFKICFIRTVVSDSVYVFNGVSEMSTRWFIHHYITAFEVHYFSKYVFSGC